MHKAANDQPTKLSLRKPALMAASGLLAMAIIAPLAVGIIARLTGHSDVAIVDQNIVHWSTLFWFAAIGFTIIAILDAVVALALYQFFKPVSKRLALMAALARIVYAGGLLIAVSWLIRATMIPFPTIMSQTFIMHQHASTFTAVWTAVLAIFGLHLIVLGWLTIKAQYTPNWLGALLVLAGIGYGVDGLTSVLAATRATHLTQFVFFGEVALMVWLFIHGRKKILLNVP